VTFDFRHPDKATVLAMEADMIAAVDDCCERANVKAEVTQTWEFGNEVFDDACIEMVKNAAEELQVPYQEMLSQAGHDAYHMTRITPTALLFSPCKEGITHNENEHIELEYTTPAVNVLLHAVLTRANR
jgi:N-carbamoyl-L-amino-acid hydrolase